MMDREFRSDPMGFPMLRIDKIDAYIHWFPVTKIQFEHFLCAAPDTRFHAGWYEEILALNPRVSPGKVRADNYWRALLTGIQPDEVLRFAEWCGEDYSVLTFDEWLAAFKVLKKEGPHQLPEVLGAANGDLPDRGRRLLQSLDAAAEAAFRQDQKRTLADQMLLRMGVMDWVRQPGGQREWGGMGQPHSRFHGSLFNPDHGRPAVPNNPEEDRLHTYGFRLVWRES